MSLLVRLLNRRHRSTGGRPTSGAYERLYEAHAVAAKSDEEAIGGGDYEVIGRIELALLIDAGLRPTHTLVDFGCGIGRLAAHAVPYLQAGRFIGIDIADTLLAEARARIRPGKQESGCVVDWIKQTTTTFNLPDASVDAMCAYSVFTHIEHEDTYNYLVDARRAIKPGGFFAFSCLPVGLPDAQRIFKDEAAMEFGTRWARVRNVITSKELITGIATLAGWNVRRWRDGTEESIPLPGGGRTAFGHATCVLQ